MSWLKFWKSSKKDDKKTRSELVRSESFKDDSTVTESEKEKNSRLRHAMSISRSGRFKQKNKQRSGILDNDFYSSSNDNSAQKENIGTGQNPISHQHEQKKPTPPSTCRDVTSQQMTSHRYEGHTTVL